MAQRTKEVTYVSAAEATKINIKTWEPWMWRHQLHRDGRFEPLANSARSLTWAYKVKTLKSSL